MIIRIVARTRERGGEMNKGKKSFFVVVILGVFLMFPLTVYAHYDRAYWHEEQETTQFVEQYVDWMITVPDSVQLSDLSIPGTHDTMAYNNHLIFGDISRTQSMTLEQQLRSGIRYLDIRLNHKGDHFQLHHGSIDLGYNFDDVMRKIIVFLQKYPTETVFMRVKQEYSSRNDLEMLELFTKYYKKYEDFFWDKELSAVPDNPPLSELRGKVLIFSDVYSIRYGINYRDVLKQDSYYLGTNWDLYSKWEAIKSQVINSNSEDQERITMNYLSGSGGVMPYFVASGHTNPDTYGNRLSTGLTEPGFKSYYPDFPRTGRIGGLATISFEGMNSLTADYLSEKMVKRAGIIVADFPGERLINEVIQCNYKMQNMKFE